VGKPGGKRQLSRPRRKRKGNIKMDLQVVGFGGALRITDDVIMSLVSPPGPGGLLPSSQFEPSSKARKTCTVIVVCTETF
jgi:hypothetical protein